MSLSQSEVEELIYDALSQLERQHGPENIKSVIAAYFKGYSPITYLYKPDDALMTRISEYCEWSAGKREEEPGKLMEEIALLAFRCLKGWNSIRSYQSYAAQIDLVISGSDSSWFTLLEYLHIDHRYNTIVIEAKNIDKKVEDQQFKRLCYIVQNEFAGTAALGIFVTRRGASGFPERNNGRLRALKNAQATQIFFFAKTSKYIVVFDEQDIMELVKPGALPRLLEAKIRAVEQWTGIPDEIDDSPVEIDLPPHLRKYL